MKKLSIIFILASYFSNAQCADKQIVDFDESPHANQTGFYYKDLHNVYNNFEGTYKYTNGSTSFEIVLQKKEGSIIPSGRYCQDMIIGGYKYIKNGQLITDQLSNVNINLSNGTNHIISGSLIYTGTEYGCDECSPNEKRLKISIEDPHSGDICNTEVRRIVHYGQQAIKIHLSVELWARIRIEGDPPLPEIMLPMGQDLILIKQ